jgi:hypothetical protein
MHLNGCRPDFDEGFGPSLSDYADMENHTAVAEAAITSSILIR